MSQTPQLTSLDLLNVALRAAERLRAERDHLAVEGRLGLLDRLQPDMTSGSRDPARDALRQFVYDCRNIADRGATWLWCQQTLADCGFDSEAIADGPRNTCVDDGYPAPVASFDPNPSRYVWVPVESLPTFHNPFKCGHSHVYRTDLEARRQDARRSRLVKWFGWRQATDAADPEEAAGADLQTRILTTNDLPPCRTHLHVDWSIVLSAAANIHGSVRPWTEDAARQAIDTYPFPPSETPDVRCPEEERLVLRSLFFKPITWDGTNSRVSNGQHRICGMRTAGIPLALINQI